MQHPLLRGSDKLRITSRLQEFHPFFKEAPSLARITSIMSMNSFRNQSSSHKMWIIALPVELTDLVQQFKRILGTSLVTAKRG